MYGLLTGLSPFYDEPHTSKVQKKVIAGELPYIDPRYSKRSFEEAQMVSIMKECWEYDADKRPSIFDIVHKLRAAVALKKNGGSSEKKEE